MNKKDIKTRLKENNSIRGGTFLPIIQLCLLNGGKFEDRFASLEKPFTGDKSGIETCTIIGPITVKDVLEKYSIPDHITYGENGFWDSKDSVNLNFISLKRHKEYQALREKNRAKRDARIAARRKRKALNDGK